MANTKISEQLDIALDRLHSVAQSYRFSDELLLEFRGYCIGYAQACRDHFSPDERQKLLDYANLLLRERGGQKIGPG